MSTSIFNIFRMAGKMAGLTHPQMTRVSLGNQIITSPVWPQEPTDGERSIYVVVATFMVFFLKVTGFLLAKFQVVKMKAGSSRFDAAKTPYGFV